MNFYFQPVSWATVRDVPVTYLKNAARPPGTARAAGRDDRPVARIRSTVIELDTGHIPAVTQPAAFAAILEDIAAHAERTASMTDLYWDPFDIEIDREPYEIWRRMRDEAPLYRNERFDF